MVILTRTFARERRWRSLTFWSGLLASAALSLFFVQGEGPWIGLIQRSFVAIISVWLVMLAFRVRSAVSRPGTSDLLTAVPAFRQLGDERDEQSSEEIRQRFLEHERSRTTAVRSD
jgi:hypothetical protein